MIFLGYWRLRLANERPDSPADVVIPQPVPLGNIPTTNKRPNKRTMDGNEDYTTKRERVSPEMDSTLYQQAVSSVLQVLIR